MAETKIFEDDQRIVWESVFGNWPDESGSRRELRVEWKPGSEGLVAQQAAVNRTDVASQLANALANLQAIIDSPSPGAGTLTGAALSNAVRDLTTAAKVLARNQRRLIRWGLDAFDGSD